MTNELPTNLPDDLPILELLLRDYKNFNARATRDATIAYWRHIERGGRMFWAVAGAMSSAQLGITLAPAIRAGLIHGMSVTGANLEESLFRLVAHDHYRDFPDYRYFTKQDDTRILNDRMRRVTDTSIPEDEAFRAVEKYIVPMWKRASEHGERRFWHEYFYELIQTIGPELHKGFGLLYSALASPEAKNATREKLASRFSFLSKAVEDRPFLTGSTFTVADGYAFYTLRNWQRSVRPELPSAALQTYFDRIAGRPAVRAALEAEAAAPRPER